MRFSTTLIVLGVIFIIGAILSGCKKQFSSFSSDRSAKLLINEKIYPIELARIAQEQEQGLSDRTAIGSDGMLFVFNSPGTPKFWMKDMLFDLDFIWIRKGEIVEIMPNVPRPQDKAVQLPIYKPAQQVDMMLEVNAGFAQKENLKVGDKVTLSDQ
ncbi:MAG: DUF192 domain-containing protein [Patescibacteria group bacterium]